MNAFVRPAKHVFVRIGEIDISHAIRPYNATVVGELARSIREIGLQTPLTCILRDDQHILVSGRNRLEALRTIGAEQAPVRVVDFTDVEARLWRLSENLHRAELTKLEYDKQVVQYAELLKVKQAGGTAAPQPEGDKVRQVGAVSGGRGNTGGYREAARELNVPEQTVRRAYQTASLSPEAQEAAVKAGLDNNRSVLHEVAKERTPEAQTATIRRFADRKSAVAEKADRYLADQDDRLKAREQIQLPAKPLRNLENISGGELARWIKQTTPNDRPHVIRVLEMATAILRDEMQAGRAAQHVAPDSTMSTPDKPDAPKPKWTKGGPSPNPGGKRKRPPEPAQPAQSPAAQIENTTRKQRHYGFQPGQSGNPAGRPPGSLNKSTLAALAIMEADAERISKKAVALALDGDLTAIKIVLDRLVSPARDRPIRLELPKVEKPADLVSAASSITAGVASGAITPNEAAALSVLVGNVAKAIETNELAERIARLEAQRPSEGGRPVQAARPGPEANVGPQKG